MSMMADIGILNAHYSRSEVWKKSLRRWFGPHLGASGILLSIIVALSGKPKFFGFSWKHIEQPLLKSVLDEVWGCNLKSIHFSLLAVCIESFLSFKS